MKTTPRFVGLDVHAATIAVAVAEPNGEVHSLGTIPNDADAVRRLVRKLGPFKLGTGSTRLVLGSRFTSVSTTGGSTTFLPSTVGLTFGK